VLDAPETAPSLAASGRRRPPQRATPKNSRLGFFGNPSGRTLGKRRSARRTASSYRACGYKTASGRPKWLNADPAGLAGGLNLYAYVGNNPISGIDPLGLVNINLFPGPSDLTSSANNFNMRGVFTVGGHGVVPETGGGAMGIATPKTGMTKGNNWAIDANQLAKMIVSDPAYKVGEPVALIACATGEIQANGGPSIGQQLSAAIQNLTGVSTTVVAPGSIATLGMDGVALVDTSSGWDVFRGGEQLGWQLSDREINNLAGIQSIDAQGQPMGQVSGRRCDL
jgi:RHS repeat-associated protein